MNSPQTAYRRSPDADVERNGDEIILLHTQTLEFRVLNTSGAVLWDALDEFDTAELLTSLLSEAYPETESATHHENVERFLSELVTAGFLVAEPAPASR